MEGYIQKRFFFNNSVKIFIDSFSRKWNITKPNLSYISYIFIMMGFTIVQKLKYHNFCFLPKYPADINKKLILTVTGQMSQIYYFFVR